MIKILIPIFTFVILVSCSSEEAEIKKNLNAKVETSKVKAVEKVAQNIISNEVVENKKKLIIENKETTKVGEISLVDEKKEEKKSPKTKPEVVSTNQIIEVIPVEEKVLKVEEEVENTIINTSISHSIWNNLLKQNVSTSGDVNYKGFKSNKAELEEYITLLKTKTPANDWSKNEKLAYWINVYNAFTVRLIVVNYPLKSITDLNKPWDQKIIDIAGVKYSLGDIENNILRKMGESRIHFAINCASISCPRLLNEAFTAEKLSAQLRKVTKSFFNDATKNNLAANPIKISKLFEWYKSDFSEGDILKYINKYSGKTINSDTKIEYLEYNWSLNE